MTRIWMAVITAAAVVGACNEPQVSHAAKTSEPAQPPATTVPTMAPDATAAMTATSGAAGSMTRGEATPVEGADLKNILGLKLPKIDKTVANWKHGLKRPDPFPAKFDAKKDYFATLHTTKGDITVKFFPEIAPKHVTSFIYLSTIGYYDDAPFHRVCKDFMMQGGDPSGQGTGGPGYTVPREFNARKHVKGILSAARTPDPDSAGSQFFLMFTAYPSLDNQYSVFGQVIEEDMKVVETYHSTVAVPQSVPGCRPKSLEKIKNVTVSTKDKK